MGTSMLPIDLRKDTSPPSSWIKPSLSFPLLETESRAFYILSGPTLPLTYVLNPQHRVYVFTVKEKHLWNRMCWKS